MGIKRKTKSINRDLRKLMVAQRQNASQKIGGKRRGIKQHSTSASSKVTQVNLKPLQLNQSVEVKEFFVVYSSDEIHHYKAPGASKISLHMNPTTNICGFLTNNAPTITNEKDMEDSGHEAAPLLVEDININEITQSLQNMKGNPDVAAAASEMANMMPRGDSIPEEEEPAMEEPKMAEIQV